MGDDTSRRLILARRARFVAAALASVAATAGAVTATEGCSGGVEDPEQQTDGGTTSGDGATPQPCLKQRVDASPQPCLGEPRVEEEDAGPRPCLFAPVDGG